MQKKFKIVSWNLGNSMYPASHFYLKAQDALKRQNIFPVDKKTAQKNVLGQIKILKEINADIMLFQEISKLQPQNCFINIFYQFTKQFSEYTGTYYSSVNILNIINQGKATFTKIGGNSFPIICPTKLKGHFNNFIFGNATTIVTEIPVNEDIKFIIINIHLTPFERSRIERQLQLEYIFNYANEEYNKGNYVLIGGDWNMDMPIVNKYNNYQSIGSVIPKKLIVKFHKDEWKLIFSEKPTLRDLSTPYSVNSKMSTIDGYLLSKNIELINIENINDFKYSDHCPVVINIKLKDKL